MVSGISCFVASGCNHVRSDSPSPAAPTIQSVNTMRPLRPDEKSSYATFYGRPRVTESGKVLVAFPIAGEAADRITTGNPVRVSHQNESSVSTIASISPNPGGDGFLAQVVCDLPASTLASGASVLVRVAIPDDEASRERGYWLPTSALSRKRGGGWSVLVVENSRPAATPSTSDIRGVVTRRSVGLIAIENDWVRVVGDITEVSSVIVDGTHRVVAGQFAEARGVARF